MSEQPQPSPPAQPEHVHMWEILERWSPAEPAHPRLRAERVTYVLVRCKTCDLPQTVELSGVWTLEQLLKNHARVERRDDGG
jgi:hypothetical protein